MKTLEEQKSEKCIIEPKYDNFCAMILDVHRTTTLKSKDGTVRKSNLNLLRTTDIIIIFSIAFS